LGPVGVGSDSKSTRLLDGVVHSDIGKRELDRSVGRARHIKYLNCETYSHWSLYSLIRTGRVKVIRENKRQAIRIEPGSPAYTGSGGYEQGEVTMQITNRRRNNKGTRLDFKVTHF